MVKGLFEYNIIPFELKNTPRIFWKLMDKILKKYIKEFIVIYIDNIIIYSESFKNYIMHIEKKTEKWITVISL
jgi:hypothetical protein